MQKYFLAFLCVFLSFHTICEAQEPVISREVQENIKKRVENGINAGIIVGVISSDGSTYYSYGVKSFENNEAVDENTVFQIASISKTFTGILMADLVVKGELNVNDPLQSLLPKGVNAPTKNGQSIELLHLANHTSSLPNMPSNFDMTNLENPFATYSEKQLYDFLNTYELNRDIGSEYTYSNYGMGLLGHLLASRSKLDYEGLLTEVLTKPLNLKNTSTAFTPQMRKNLAIGHNIGLEVANWDYLSTFAGAAGIRSSAKDMLQYLAYNMGIEGSDLFPAMQLSHMNTRKEGDKPMVGYGWQIMERSGMEIIWHDGELGGYCSFAGFNKSEDIGVVVLTNSNVGVTDIGIHLLDSSFSLGNPKPSVGAKLRGIIETEGMEKARNAYWELKEKQPNDFDLGENQMNMLGQLYLWDNEIEHAISVLDLNVEAFPDSYNAYYRYGEALMQKNDTTRAIAAFLKSKELYPDSFNAIKKLKMLGVDIDSLMLDVIVEDSILEGYVGKYELLPNFILTVTKQGSQLKTQANGKPKFSIFPKSNNVFYYKVLPAQITFNRGDNGVIESVTFVQEGEKIVGKKLIE